MPDHVNLLISAIIAYIKVFTMNYKFRHVPAMAIPSTAFPTSLPIIHSYLEAIMLSKELAKRTAVHSKGYSGFP